MMRRLALAVPLALFIAFVAVAVFGLGTPQNRPVRVAPGRTARA